MKKWVLFLLGFFLFLLLGYLCLYKQVIPILEVKIKNRVNNSLALNNFPKIRVVMYDNGLVLQGTVSSEVLKTKVTRIVVAIDEYHLIKNNLMITPKQILTSKVIEPYRLLLRLKANRSIVISGHLPDLEMKNKLLNAMTRRYGGKYVTDDLSIKSNPPANWQETIMLALNALPSLIQAQVKLSGQEFSLIGVANSTESREQVGEYLEHRLPENFRGKLDIAIISNNKLADRVEASQNRTIPYCQQEFKYLLTKNNILFQTGKVQVTKENVQLLDKLALVALGCPNEVIIIAGYTDTKGSKQNNKKLSKKRAEAIVYYLQEKGLRKQSLKAIGYGEREPVAPNLTAEGRALNRRIELTIEGRQ